MTLIEAVNHICQQDNCSRRAATRQIRAALADNALGSLRWEDQSKNAGAAGTPPIDPWFWQEARIQRGRVFDPWTKQWRVLLILEHSVFQHWPEPITKEKAGGRPSAGDQIHQALDQLSQQGHRVKDMALKKLEELVASKCGKQIGEKGWSWRTMQRHIGSWRSKH
jgi:hypothetical protein